MYKVMLVDDEFFARTALRQSLSWESCGCEICAEAKNGMDGLEKARECQPDLIITDINMPVMNGLDMVAALQKELPHTIFALLTGYSEFEYARRGMELGIRYFITKPVDNEKMLETVKNMVAVLEKNAREKLEYKYLNFWATQNNTENRKRFVELLLAGKQDILQTQFSFECERLQLNLAQGGYGVCALKIDSRTRTQYTQSQWQALIEELLGAERSKWTLCAYYKGGGFLYLIFSKLEESDWNPMVITSLMQKIQIGLLQRLTCTVIAGVGTYCDDYRQICASSREAEKNMKDIQTSYLIADALRIIHEKYADPEFSVRAIAEALFVNYSYLSAQFAKEIKMPISQYITKFRMTKAGDLLRNGNSNMTQIATSVGYVDVKYFYRVFKKEFGVTPYQYLNQVEEDLVNGQTL